MFDAFRVSLNELRQHTARFRRVAFHMHSPESHDWAQGGGDPERNNREKFLADGGWQLFANELGEHLDFVCITDHMRCTYASTLSLNSRHPIILPGMEVNLRIEPLDFTRIHVLCIFPENSTPERFARLLASQNHIPEDAQRTGNEEITGLSLKEWVDKVRNEGGLSIAAHVDSARGIRCGFRQASREVIKLFTGSDSVQGEQEYEVPDTLKNYLFDSGLDAIEVNKSSDGKHYRWVSERDGSSRSIATVLTFDAHWCERFSEADRVTHVKMTSLGIDGLRNALQFSDTRIRFPDNLPEVPNPRILGISIDGGDESFFKDVTLAFAENLTCLIGVRGSGKTTIVEALRYVFGYNRSLGELGKSMESAVREMQAATLTGSLIRIAYQTSSGDVRVLQATFDPKEDYSTRCFELNGDPVEIADVEQCGEFPLRLFGWSEIETLGRSHARQRDLLDRLIPEMAQATRERDEIRNELTANRGILARHVSELASIYATNNYEIKRYREYLSDFDRLNTADVKLLFSSLDLAKAKKRMLEKVASNVQAKIQKLEPFVTLSLREELDEILSGTVGDELRDWWQDFELPALDIETVELNVGRLVTQAVESLRAFGQEIQERTETITEEIGRIEQELQVQLDSAGDEAMQRIADLRANAEKRLQRAAGIRRKYNNVWADLQKALDERRAICERLSERNKSIAEIRTTHNQNAESTLNRFLPAWMTVSIDFIEGGDKEDFQALFPKIVKGKSNAKAISRLRAYLAQNLDPVSCAQLVLDDDFESIVGNTVEMNGASVEIEGEFVENWKTKIYPFELDESAEVTCLAEDGQRLNDILDLQETEWDDFVAILLDGRPVNEKSPGQRASAMLPLIALSTKSPLVIDQPEDNLDKRLVGSVLMQVLAELKEQRQIIVCTHDPNILVGGDAEQVIVLEAQSDKEGSVKTHGSIDNQEIVSTVIDLLEGGKEAFETRHKRYGLRGENAVST